MVDHWNLLYRLRCVNVLCFRHMSPFVSAALRPGGPEPLKALPIHGDPGAAGPARARGGERTRRGLIAKVSHGEAAAFYPNSRTAPLTASTPLQIASRFTQPRRRKSRPTHS